jgi:hypothetical protein
MSLHSVEVNTATLLSALVANQAPSQPSQPSHLPLFSVRDRCLRITTFPAEMSGMRVQTVAVASSDCLCFRMSEKLCRFLQRCRGYHNIIFSLDNGTLKVTLKSTCSALQVEWPEVDTVEEVYFDRHVDDITMSVATDEWFKLWQTVPDTGEVTVHCHARRKTVTLTHVSNKWAAVIRIPTAADRDGVFVCRGDIAKTFFGTCPIGSTFSVLTFMSNGVLKWEVGKVEVYLAPFVKEP